MSGPFRLLDLPREIREHVYRTSFASSTPPRIMVRHQHSDSPTPSTFEGAAPPLLLISSEIYEEALAVLRQQLAFSLIFHFRFNSSVLTDPLNWYPTQVQPILCPHFLRNYTRSITLLLPAHHLACIFAWGRSLSSGPTLADMMEKPTSIYKETIERMIGVKPAAEWNDWLANTFPRLDRLELRVYFEPERIPVLELLRPGAEDRALYQRVLEDVMTKLRDEHPRLRGLAIHVNGDEARQDVLVWVGSSAAGASSTGRTQQNAVPPAVT